MNTNRVRSLVLTAAMLVANAVFVSAAEPSKEDAALSAKLITAVETADYDAFVADGDSKFKEMKRDRFAEVAARLAPKFQAGYAVSYLGELKQTEARVTLWKVEFKGHPDDSLVTLVVKDGRVAGFWIK